MITKGEINGAPVVVRYVGQVPVGTAGATVILGASYVASWLGMNGRGGFLSGKYERRLNEEGSFELTFPNASGGDGVMHRDRFQIVSSAYPNYRPGDEWFEIWRANDERKPVELLFVGTPEKATVTRSTITLSGWDAFFTLKRVRDTAASFWCHDPRTVFEHYSRAWVSDAADDFTGVAGGAPSAQWTRTTSGGTSATLDGQSALSLVAGSTGGKAFITAPLSTNCDRWQVSATVISCSGGTAQGIFIGVVDVPTSPIGTFVGMNLGPATNGQGIVVWVSASSGVGLQPKPLGPFTLPAEIKVECDKRWAYMYVSGQLINVVPVGTIPANYFYVGTDDTSALSNGNVTRIDNAFAKTCRPYLMRNASIGDVRLPGAPTPGGLLGEYFDAHGQKAQDPSNFAGYIFNGTTKPAAKRLDTPLEFGPLGSPSYFNTYAPPDGATYGGDVNALRWTGSIYLDLDNFDYAFQLTSVDDFAKLWIGDCRDAQLYTFSNGGTVSANWVKAGSAPGSAPSGATGILAGMRSGWYPIKVEYINSILSAELHLKYERSDAVGTYGPVRAVQDIGPYNTPAVSAVKTAPQGVFNGNPRVDSHYNQILDIVKTFGLQFTCTPKSLESGEFPGNINPFVRVGRDTEYALDSIEGVDLTTNIDAGDTCDDLILDGAGTGANDGSTTTRNGVMYSQAKSHMFLNSDADTAGDVTFPPLLAQRANSLIALRQSPWQDTGVKPKGKSQILDSFPIAGTFALFGWVPGDGVRLNLPELGVVDSSPRQILGVSWPFSQNGVGRPDASFRQRPRGIKYLLADQFRQAALERRNYQGSITQWMGTLGQKNLPTSGTDEFSRIVMPEPFANLVKMEFCVLYRDTVTTLGIEVNSVVTNLVFTTADVFDVTQWADPQKNTQAPGRNYVRVLGAAGTDHLEYCLRVTSRV